MNDLSQKQKLFAPKEERKLSEVVGSYTYFANDDVLLAKITPCFENGKLGVARNLTNGIGFGSSEYFVFRASKAIDAEFLYHFLSRDIFRIDGARVMTGAVGHKRVPKDFIETLEIQLPPLAEQKRIVAILDEAFEGIAAATANAEKNLANARELFDSYLNSVFLKKGEGWVEKPIGEIAQVFDGPHATPKTIDAGPIFLGISALQDGVVNLDETRHVTSEDFKKWTRRVKPSSGDVVFSYETRLGQAAIIPDGLECCLGRRMGLVRVDRKAIDPRFFLYQYISSAFREYLGTMTVRGATVDRIPLKEFPTYPIHLPPIDKQRGIVSALDRLSVEAKRLEAIYIQKLYAFAELKQSILQKAFAGELTWTVDTNLPEFTAYVLAFSYHHHLSQMREKTFGHVKAQKTLHLAESIGGVELGRQPIKDAAGPNDFPHMLKAEEWAKSNQFFEFKKKDASYDFKKLSRYDELIARAFKSIAPYKHKLQKVVDLLLPMDTQEAEVFATVHAAWNNLILDKADISDVHILYEARENWHRDKLKIPEEAFKKAIRLIRDNGLVPNGSAKRVGGQESLPL